MSYTERKNLFLLVIALFSLVILTAQFFHQEETLSQADMDNCTICQWLRNSIALALLYFFIAFIAFIILHCLGTFYKKKPFFYFFYHYSLRAPPKN